MPEAKRPYRFQFTGRLFRYSVESTSWFFVETDKDLATTIRSKVNVTKGFGSIRVEVTVGKTTWRTSLFPTKQKTYLLAIKADVRRTEDMREGDRVAISGRLL